MLIAVVVHRCHRDGGNLLLTISLSPAAPGAGSGMMTPASCHRLPVTVGCVASVTVP